MPPATHATVPRKSSGCPGDRDVRGVPERSGDVRERVALLELLGHLERGLPDGLHDQGDRPPFQIRVGDGQRDALRARVRTDHDELSGSMTARDAVRLDLEQSDVLSERPLDADLEHGLHLSERQLDRP